ncbi:MAG: hypothetical protein KDE31_24580, partial [Caldilineaceae bacterium]|nr:hypothetical protein [Caldilineaceae bacterium]
GDYGLSYIDIFIGKHFYEMFQTPDEGQDKTSGKAGPAGQNGIVKDWVPLFRIPIIAAPTQGGTK